MKGNCSVTPVHMMLPDRNVHIRTQLRPVERKLHSWLYKPKDEIGPEDFFRLNELSILLFLARKELQYSRPVKRTRGRPPKRDHSARKDSETAPPRPRTRAGRDVYILERKLAACVHERRNDDKTAFDVESLDLQCSELQILFKAMDMAFAVACRGEEEEDLGPFMSFKDIFVESGLLADMLLLSVTKDLEKVKVSGLSTSVSDVNVKDNTSRLSAAFADASCLSAAKEEEDDYYGWVTSMELMSEIFVEDYGLSVAFGDIIYVDAVQEDVKVSVTSTNSPVKTQSFKSSRAS